MLDPGNTAVRKAGGTVINVLELSRVGSLPVGGFSTSLVIRCLFWGNDNDS